MKITIIGTTSYLSKMLDHKRFLESYFHQVELPAFDDHPELTPKGICDYNLAKIKWADEVHLFWDQRSMGTIFDFGMCFALGKPIHIVYMEPKTFRTVMEQYEDAYKGFPGEVR